MSLRPFFVMKQPKHLVKTKKDLLTLLISDVIIYMTDTVHIKKEHQDV